MILVDVFVPALNDRFDVMLDEDTKVKIIIQELVEMLATRSRETLSYEGEFALYSMNPESSIKERRLGEKKTLNMCGIVNGGSLLLV